VSATVFVVQRRALIQGYEPRTDVSRPKFTPFVPLRLFSDRKAAEAYRDEILLRLRRAVNPFALGQDLYSLTSMPYKAFVNCLWGLNVVPPQPGPGGSDADPLDWRAWWEETAPGLSLEQLNAVWELLDRFRLVEVVELMLHGEE
jgi:hypothetical protein